MNNPFNRFFRTDKEESEKDLPLKEKEDESKSSIDYNEYGNPPPYEPTLDLRSYQFPEVSLFQKEEYFKRLGEYSNSLSLPFLFSINENKIICKDLAEVKNLFVVGTQATGKTNLLHQIILSLLFTKHPSQLKLILIDPKQVEFNAYRHIEKHFLAKLPGEEEAIIADTKKVVLTLNALCIEMDNRYDLLKKAGARNIKEYNEKFTQRKLNPQKGHQYLPYLVLLINDIAGYIRVENDEIIIAIQRLVNEGYKVGQYNILSTSQITNEIIPSSLLSLIGQRVAFRLNSKDEYKKLFDTVRLNKFLKEGEFLYNENAKIQEGKSLLIYYSDIEKVVEFINKQKEYSQAFLLPEYVDEKETEGKDFDLSDRDSLFEDAARLIVQNQIGSTALLQRRMKLGYNRAGRLMDQLESAGIVGPSQGSKARDVLIKTEMELQQHLDALG